MTIRSNDVSAALDPERIDRLAAVAVRIGLNLQAGQDLLVTAPAAALPLVRRIASHAYRAGANLVTPLLSDEELTLARYRDAPDTSFDQAPNWLHEGVAKAFDANTARLAILGDDPMLLAEQDPGKVARAAKANAIAYKPALERIAAFAVNWNIVAWPGTSWAARLFPGEPEAVAVNRLADAIFSASRLDDDDPVAAWKSHNAELRRRTGWLNERNFSALRFVGPGTDLLVGLADDHEWQGGASAARNGIVCNPNIPTEEVFTTPHAARVEGHVSSTKPLSHQGALIDDIRVRFEAGRIVEARAARGEEVLSKVLDTDEGARRLGEVALVPHSSPISKSGLLFLNTLFDENAASHIALGQCYAKCFRNGGNLSPDAVAAKGGNASLIHIDWMIGSNRIDVDGVNPDNTTTPVFRQGEWAA